jgi:hypothetical protein
MVFESWRDRLRWVIEHDGEHFRKWHISNSVISWTSENQRTFSLLFGHPAHCEIQRGLVPSLYWSQIKLAQSRRSASTKGESSPKMMLTVVWNPRWFRLIDVLLKGSKFNAGHDISHILSPLSEILAPYQDDPRKHFVIHADNVRSHYEKRFLSLWVIIPYAEQIILLIH